MRSHKPIGCVLLRAVGANHCSLPTAWSEAATRASSIVRILFGISRRFQNVFPQASTREQLHLAIFEIQGQFGSREGRLPLRQDQDYEPTGQSVNRASTMYPL
ncbi:hypothetical protein N431DRAFT_31859 [Stipitochalara longipes BDJ]|nr:hypothetical protein N431DRAFT_31859 [Stipitochalara longipes BDJ]